MSMKNRFRFDLENIDEVAAKFIEFTGSYTIFAFYGEMGSGKTTFIKEVCKLMGAENNVTSPSFSLVNEYNTKNNHTVIYHFDFFRVESVEEVFDLGYEDYFYSGRKCFIEWPEKAEALLPPNTVRSFLKILDDNTRELKIST